MSPFELERTLDELWPTWARGSDVLTVVTLYDLIPLIFSDHYLNDPVMRTRYQARAELVRRADHVLAISQTTAQDATEHLEISPDRITVITAGATEKFAKMYRTPADAWSVLASRLTTIRPGFILYVAGFEFRKNLKRVMEAFGRVSRELRAAHQLVITCRMLSSEVEQMRAWAREAGIADEELVITGQVTDEELGALYRTCALFLFASLYEGSGLPILEAMSCGAPVVASNTSTGPEILGDIDGTFDPYDPTSIADCIETVIDSTPTLHALIERSRRRVDEYTWHAVAEHSAQAYTSLLNQRSSGVRRRSRRRRIALVTPWPPERSGIADYNLRLAAKLGETVDVDVIVRDPVDRYATPQTQGVRLIDASRFRTYEALRQPDRILYCMGNSSFHAHVYELLRERPGAVVAHDVRLTGFYGWLAGQERPEDPADRLIEHIKALYGSRIPPSLLGGNPPDWERQSALGIYMTREIQQYAEQIFVHSHHAREVVNLDRGMLDREVPVSILPFGVPASEFGERRPKGTGGVVVVVSVGVVSEVKGLATLIAAASLLTENFALRLVIAGPGEENELQRWRDLAKEVAPNADTRIPGHLGTERYRSLLEEADLAVQLRTLSNGEASAAVADCLAAGVPTIASDLGWASELPMGALERVPHDVSPTRLAERIRELLHDEQRRATMSDAATAYARASSFSHVAQAYKTALGLG
jgi:glycosyltransferase involved in cell wall biosynthesis